MIERALAGKLRPDSLVHPLRVFGLDEHAERDGPTLTPQFHQVAAALALGRGLLASLTGVKVIGIAWALALVRFELADLFAQFEVFAKRVKGVAGRHPATSSKTRATNSPRFPSACWPCWLWRSRQPSQKNVRQMAQNSTWTSHNLASQ